MRVLLIDDDRIIRHAFGRLLESCGCEVVAAPPNELPAGRFDLVITDYFMKSVQAVPFAHLLERRYPGTPRVVLSAADLSGGEAEKLKKLGYREVLEKPLLHADAQKLIERYQPDGGNDGDGDRP